jgi:hypothetical protein
MEETNLQIGNGKRVAWKLAALEEATGMSVAFWKKVISRGDLPATKAGACTLVMDEDARAYLLKNRKLRGMKEE